MRVIPAVAAALTAVMMATMGFAVVACASPAKPHPQDPQLAGFPDLSGYTADDPKNYELFLPNGGLAPQPTVYFTTPDGVLCNFGQPDNAACMGSNIPGLPESQRNPSNAISTAYNLHATSVSNDDRFPGGLVQGQKPRTLPPFHSLTMYGVTCGVDDSGVTACKGPKGTGAFVLSPQGDRWMPL